VDEGECSHKNGRGTWVSEVGYDSAKVYRGDTGDSYKMLARIAWFDGHARKRVGDTEMFDRILDPIVDDVLKYLWLNERYDCEVNPGQRRGEGGGGGACLCFAQHCCDDLGCAVERLWFYFLPFGVGDAST